MQNILNVDISTLNAFLRIPQDHKKERKNELIDHNEHPALTMVMDGSGHQGVSCFNFFNINKNKNLINKNKFSITSFQREL